MLIGVGPSWRASIDVGKGFDEKVAQHVGDGDAALERRDLDAAAQSDVTSIVNRAVKAPFFAAASAGASGDLIRLSTSPGRGQIGFGAGAPS